MYCRSDDMAATKVEADRCWNSGVQLMVVGVGDAVSGDMWALKELRTISRSQTAISDDRRPRRMFLSPNFESLGNTRQPITDALCSSTPSLSLSLSLYLNLSRCYCLGFCLAAMEEMSDMSTGREKILEIYFCLFFLIDFVFKLFYCMIFCSLCALLVHVMFTELYIFEYKFINVENVYDTAFLQIQLLTSS